MLLCRLVEKAATNFPLPYAKSVTLYVVGQTLVVVAASFDHCLYFRKLYHGAFAANHLPFPYLICFKPSPMGVEHKSK